jgi:hypothetical protein
VQNPPDREIEKVLLATEQNGNAKEDEYGHRPNGVARIRNWCDAFGNVKNCRRQTSSYLRPND